MFTVVARGYALMWSGGKDSALALQRARACGLDVRCLLNFYESATARVRFHATTIQMIEAQAAALSLELRAVGTTREAMPSALGDQLKRLRSEDFKGVILGDIHLADVRGWYEERVTAAALEHVEPLWGAKPLDLVREFVEAGGRAVVTCVDLDRLNATWLGRVIDLRFPEDIAATGVDACGENGEYHSFAFEGPPFTRPVQWWPGLSRTEGRFAQLDVLPAQP